jgi:hypothetical protein
MSPAVRKSGHPPPPYGPSAEATEPRPVKADTNPRWPVIRCDYCKAMLGRDSKACASCGATHPQEGS